MRQRHGTRAGRRFCAGARLCLLRLPVSCCCWCSRRSSTCTKAPGRAISGTKPPSTGIPAIIPDLQAGLPLAWPGPLPLPSGRLACKDPRYEQVGHRNPERGFRRQGPGGPGRCHRAGRPLFIPARH